MSDVVIRVENLSKLYRIGQRERYKTLRESLIDCLRAPLRAVSAVVGRGSEVEHQRLNSYIWALKDVSFEVKQGEVIGIIGRNGAGKSTLLKILSRITKPTNGYAEIRGQVGSLLEVGTGFHPELTGRENMYLSGAILGMKKAEIERQFDQIVSFAEIEKFIDTPVKRYSSGMYLRLAFAVAAHLEPEILLVDEVLAVGDITFQKKCLGKMGEVAKGGRTVLFVTHNMAAIKSLCRRTILLDCGARIADGGSEEVVLLYIRKAGISQRNGEVLENAHLGGTSKVRVRSIKFIANRDLDNFTVFWKQPIELLVEIEVRETIKNAVFGVGIVTAEGTPILTVHHNDTGDALWSLSPGIYTINATLQNPLRAGFYKLVLGAHEAVAKTSIFYIPEAIRFQVLDISKDNGEYIAHNTGLINGYSKWQINVGDQQEAHFM